MISKLAPLQEQLKGDVSTKILTESYEKVQKLITKYEFISERYQSLANFKRNSETDALFIIRCVIPADISDSVKSVHIEHSNTTLEVYARNGAKFQEKAIEINE